VLIEAGLAGVPAVATDVGFVAEVVVHDETGLLVPSADPALVRDALVEACASAPRLGAAARRRCLARFDLAEIGARWDELLSSWSPRATPGT
jgi:glycosyltransferase involved in cell wall biosynthesis